MLYKNTKDNFTQYHNLFIEYESIHGMHLQSLKDTPEPLQTRRLFSCLARYNFTMTAMAIDPNTTQSQALLKTIICMRE